jgi:hypothetical protein
MLYKYSTLYPLTKRRKKSEFFLRFVLLYTVKKLILTVSISNAVLSLEFHTNTADSSIIFIPSARHSTVA